jgi:hypothetical protein
MTIQYPYGNQNGINLHISQVQSGLKCNCICPACKKIFVARKGPKRKHYFSHYDGINCKYGYETQLHIIAKKIIEKSKQILIPEVSFKLGREQISLAGSQLITVDSVELEHRTNNLVPDLVLKAGKRVLFVEIYVTHAVGEEKRKKIIASHNSAIEINLSKSNYHENLLEKDLFNEIVLDKRNKSWIYNSKSADILSEITKVKGTKITVDDYLGNKVTFGCKIPMRRNPDKSIDYAYIEPDCMFCPYYRENDVSCAYANKDEIKRILSKYGINKQFSENTYEEPDLQKESHFEYKDPEVKCRICGKENTDWVTREGNVGECKACFYKK